MLWKVGLKEQRERKNKSKVTQELLERNVKKKSKVTQELVERKVKKKKNTQEIQARKEESHLHK